MAAISLFLVLCLSVTFTPAIQQKVTNISLGSSLTPTSNISWMSPSGLFAFEFYPGVNGYYVGIFIARTPQKTVVWTTNRDKSPVSNNVVLNLTTDGRLVLQFSKGQSLYPGSQLFSSVSETNESMRRFHLKMQHNGNLVQYPTNTPESREYAYWQAETYGIGDNVTLNFDLDGHLYLLNSNGFNIKNVTVGGFPTEKTLYFMSVDIDGNFRLYSYKLDQNRAESVV
ncbi:hypothetical protein PTKIN_Ptkin07bG0089800 [Pterospermum kingtungense]